MYQRFILKKTVKQMIEHSLYVAPLITECKRVMHTGKGMDNFKKEGVPDTFEYCGAGAFGLVYKHIPSGLMVKFVGWSSNGVDTLVPFLRISMEGHKHLPKVLYVEETEDRQYYFVIMRELQEAFPHDSLTSKLERACRNPEEAAPSIEPSMLAACKLVHSLYAEDQIGKLDLHSGNIMKTTDGELILNDPFSWKV